MPLFAAPVRMLLLSLCLAAVTASAQTKTPEAKPGNEGAQKSAQDAATQQSKSAGGKNTGQDKDTTPASGESHLTKQQAADLLASLDSILAFVSKDTHLPNNKPIKRVIHTREEVGRILREKMNEDEGTKREERAELVLKKFGLLDRDFNLKPFLLSLLTEQVAGFYDPKTRTVNLLDWVKPEEQRPVMAHELTHALQDNRVGLEKWGNPQPEEMSRDERADNQHIQTDEAATARQAVTEGQAMLTFIDYSLKDTSKTLKDVPEFGDRLQDASGDSSSSPILARAPLVLQQSLIFPYTSGLAFEQYLLLHGGTDAAFAGALEHPPSSSHEILHPADYVAGTPVPVLAMPDVHPLLDKQWTPYDIGVMGELDVRMTAELFGGQTIAGPLAEAWDGGIYYAAQKKSATAVEKTATGSLGLLYLSRWKNTDSARTFLRVYAAQLARKYDHLDRVKEAVPDDDHQTFSTPEGDVVLSLKDKTVFISESFPRDLAAQLEQKMREVQGSGPLQNASVSSATHSPARHGELALRLAALLHPVALRPVLQQSTAPQMPR